MNTTVFVNKEEQYRKFKDLSTDAEKDALIIGILRDNPDFDEKDSQIETVFGEWQRIQKRKYTVPFFNYLVLMRYIKLINEDEIKVGMRPLSNNRFEIWVICKNKDYSILDRVYEIYQCISKELPRPVEFVFVSEEQFIGKESINFPLFI